MKTQRSSTPQGTPIFPQTQSGVPGPEVPQAELRSGSQKTQAPPSAPCGAHRGQAVETQPLPERQFDPPQMLTPLHTPPPVQTLEAHMSHEFPVFPQAEGPTLDGGRQFVRPAQHVGQYAPHEHEVPSQLSPC